MLQIKKWLLSYISIKSRTINNAMEDKNKKREANKQQNNRKGKNEQN